MITVFLWRRLVKREQLLRLQNLGASNKFGTNFIMISAVVLRRKFLKPFLKSENDFYLNKLFVSVVHGVVITNLVCQVKDRNISFCISQMVDYFVSTDISLSH